MRGVQCRAPEHAYIDFPTDATHNESGLSFKNIWAFRFLLKAVRFFLFYFQRGLEKHMTGQTSIHSH